MRKLDNSDDQNTRSLPWISEAFRSCLCSIFWYPFQGPAVDVVKVCGHADHASCKWNCLSFKAFQQRQHVSSWHLLQSRIELCCDSSVTKHSICVTYRGLKITWFVVFVGFFLSSLQKRKKPHTSKQTNYALVPCLGKTYSRIISIFSSPRNQREFRRVKGMSMSFHRNTSENNLTFQGLPHISSVKSKSTWGKNHTKTRVILKSKKTKVIRQQILSV